MESVLENYPINNQRIKKLSKDEEIVLFDVTEPVKANRIESILKPFSYFPFIPEKYLKLFIFKVMMNYIQFLK